MSTPVLITIIICGTIIALSVISAIGTAISAGKAAKTMDKIFKEDKF